MGKEGGRTEEVRKRDCDGPEGKRDGRWHGRGGGKGDGGRDGVEGREVVSGTGWREERW